MKTYSPRPPAVNQVELHPLCQQPALVTYCQHNGVILQAYSPLIRAQQNGNPILVGIAEKYGVSVPQVLVRWSLQRGFVPLPKSEKVERVRLNGEVWGFKLSGEDMGRLDKMGEGLEEGQGAICPYNANCP